MFQPCFGRLGRKGGVNVGLDRCRRSYSLEISTNRRPSPPFLLPCLLPPALRSPLPSWRIALSFLAAAGRWSHLAGEGDLIRLRPAAAVHVVPVLLPELLDMDRQEP